MTRQLTGAKAQVQARYEAQLRALVDGDIDAVAEMLSEGYTRTHNNGRILNRTEWLAQLRKGDVVYHSFEPVSTDVEVEGTKATVHATLTTDATIYGTRAVWRLQLRHSYIKSDGVWRASRTIATTTPA